MSKFVREVGEVIFEKPHTANEGFALLCKRETFWFHKPNALSPNGLNEDPEILSVI